MLLKNENFTVPFKKQFSFNMNGMLIKKTEAVTLIYQKKSHQNLKFLQIYAMACYTDSFYRLI